MKEITSTSSDLSILTSCYYLKQAHLKACLFKIVTCTNENCDVTLKRKDLEQHVTSTCEWRIIECEYCEEQHPKRYLQVSRIKNHTTLLAFSTLRHCFSGWQRIPLSLWSWHKFTVSWNFSLIDVAPKSTARFLWAYQGLKKWLFSVKVKKKSYIFVCLQDHLENCSKIPLPCPNSCGDIIPREMVKCISL